MITSLRRHLVPAARVGAVREPSATLFRGIRLRLTWWYCGVLAAALLLFGVALYLNVQQRLTNSVSGELQRRAQGLADGFPYSCSGGQPGGLFVACYDASGNLINGGPLTEAIPHFADPSLARTAITTGTASDTINAGSWVGPLQRYAVRVQDITGHTVGVIQVAAEVGQNQSALNELLRGLLILGAISLAVALVGGLFLSNRALLPARLAYTRQRDFIADASHELRTPLTMLRANAEVLLRSREHFSPDDVALLEDVVAEASFMGSLADNMLNLARLDADDLHIEQDVVDLGALSAEIVRRARSLAAEREVVLRLQNEGPALVVGDRLLLEEAALSLVDNAIKYNRPGGEVLVRTWVDLQRAHLEVGDTGIGIAPEHLARLGERFYRVDKARSRQSGGAGLGLSIAQRIAARHGGSLHLTSEPERGTTATLSLPVAG
jgi:signal transduction histidine kinase